MIRKIFRRRLINRLLFVVPFVALLYIPFTGLAAAFAPLLGSASGFAALAGGPATGAVTCTTSTVTGDVGVVAPGTFTNTGCTITGTVDTNATAAYADFLGAYGAIQFNPPPCDQTLTGTLAGVTLTPGVYCVDAVAKTGTLTLDAQGNANATWLFIVGTTGNVPTGALTGTSFTVNRIHGAESCNVYWWVAEAATMTTSFFQGTILAGADITTTGGTFYGDALAGGTGTTLAPTGAVTFSNSTVLACQATGGGGSNGGGHEKDKCNQGVGNGPEGCDPGNSNNHNPSNDEGGGKPGAPGRKGGKG
ncbi:MAG: ice-binding family protein [Vicinamibacterales bacterium]